MTALRDINFTQAKEIIEELQTATITFSELCPRRRSVGFNVVNATIDTILDKAVGSEKTEQALFLLYQLKRVLPQSGHLQLVAKHLEKVKNYDEITASQRKNYRRRLYPIFDTFLEKISGRLRY